jgi:AcrR family transcriptional regulator
MKPPRKRSDARRNEEALLAGAGVGVGTIYRHFPTRADLIVAVYRHQVQACADAGPMLLATNDSAYDALAKWIDLFVDFLVTKHGLAHAWQSDSAGYESLHAHFLDRLVPVCDQLLVAAADEMISDVDALWLMRGVGNLCIGAGGDQGYDARRMVRVLLAGLRA